MRDHFDYTQTNMYELQNNILNYYYNRYGHSVRKDVWDAQQERVDRSEDNTVITLEVDAVEGDA